MHRTPSRKQRGNQTDGVVSTSFRRRRMFNASRWFRPLKRDFSFASFRGCRGRVERGNSMSAVNWARCLEVGGALLCIWGTRAAQKPPRRWRLFDTIVSLCPISRLGEEWDLALCDVREGAAHYSDNSCWSIHTTAVAQFRFCVV